MRDVLPRERKQFTPNPPGTMPDYTISPDTDYEYALNDVAPAFGGGTELWRMLVPGMPRKQFYPRQPKWPGDKIHSEGAVKAVCAGEDALGASGHLGHVDQRRRDRYSERTAGSIRWPRRADRGGVRGQVEARRCDAQAAVWASVLGSSSSIR